MGDLESIAAKVVVSSNFLYVKVSDEGFHRIDR